MVHTAVPSGAGHRPCPSPGPAGLGLPHSSALRPRWLGPRGVGTVRVMEAPLTMVKGPGLGVTWPAPLHCLQGTPCNLAMQIREDGKVQRGWAGLPPFPGFHSLYRQGN